MRYFLDTNILVYGMKGRFPQIARELSSLNPDQVKIPAIVLAELICGALKSSDPQKAVSIAEQFVAPYEVVPFCRRCALFHGRVRARLEAKGTMIGPNDMIIAATVLAHDATLVTHNLREFQRIAELRTLDWTD